MRFGELVKRHRLARGLTLEALAKKVGTHKGYVSGWENDKVNPPAPRLTVKLAKALGIDPKALLILGWAEKAPPAIREEVFRRFVDWKEYPQPPEQVHVALSPEEVAAFEQFKAERSRRGAGLEASPATPGVA